MPLKSPTVQRPPRPKKAAPRLASHRTPPASPESEPGPRGPGSRLRGRRRSRASRGPRAGSLGVARCGLIRKCLANASCEANEADEVSRSNQRKSNTASQASQGSEELQDQAATLPNKNCSKNITNSTTKQRSQRRQAEYATDQEQNQA